MKEMKVVKLPNISDNALVSLYVLKKKGTKPKKEDLKNINPAKTYGLTFLLALLASWTLAHTFASYAAELSTTVKVLTAFGVALGFILPALWTNYLFQDAKKPLYWIDGGYWLLFYIAMGLVHAFMS